MDFTVTTTYPELPEDVKKAIAEINAHNQILLAFLLGHTNGMTEDNAKYYSIQIHDICQELMKES